MNNNIATVEGTGKWGVLFNANNQPISWREIVGVENGMVIFEGFGQYPKGLTLECDSALSAKEAFEAMLKVGEKMLC